MKWLIRFFGLPGSWKWACRKMEAGCIVRQKSATGTVRYSLDSENQRRILWCFPPRNNPRGAGVKWENANIFLSDLEATDWECV